MTLDYSKWDNIGDSDTESVGAPNTDDVSEIRRMKAACDDLHSAVESSQKTPLHGPAHYQSIIDCEAKCAVEDANRGDATETQSKSPTALSQTVAHDAEGRLLSVQALQDDDDGAYEAGEIGVGAFRGKERDEVAIRWRSGRVTVTTWPVDEKFRRAAPPRSLDAVGVAAMIGEVLRREGPLTTRDIFDRFRDVIGDGHGQIDKQAFRAALHSAASFRQRMGLWEACFDSPPTEAEGHTDPVEGLDTATELVAPQAAAPPSLVCKAPTAECGIVARPTQQTVAARNGFNYSRWDSIYDSDDDDVGNSGGGLHPCAGHIAELLKVQNGFKDLQERRAQRMKEINDINKKLGISDEY